MLMIQDKLISDDLLEVDFLCNLDACKGACCWEGDYGAPLSEAEILTIVGIYQELKPYLTEIGIKAIEEKGIATYYSEPEFMGTPLLENGACAFMTFRDGIAQCGMELAHRDGKTKFKKPISCHLYPIRVTEEPELGFSALNYDKWDICSAACKKGKKASLPVYQFAKEALIRKYGQDFYDELDAAANHLEDPSKVG